MRSDSPCDLVRRRQQGAFLAGSMDISPASALVLGTPIDLRLNILMDVVHGPAIRRHDRTTTTPWSACLAWTKSRGTLENTPKWTGRPTSKLQRIGVTFAVAQCLRLSREVGYQYSARMDPVRVHGFAFAIGLALVPSSPAASQALSLHPDNPRFFQWRGQPLVII